MYTFIKNAAYILLLILFFTFYIAFQLTSNVYAGSCSYNSFRDRCEFCTGGTNGSGGTCGITDYNNSYSPGNCNECLGFDPGQNKYSYRMKYSQAGIGGGACPMTTTQSGVIYSVQTLNSNISGCWMSGAVPNGCNHGLFCDSGTGGECGIAANVLNCPAAYRGDNCSHVPCGYRIVCNCQCNCDQECEIDDGVCVEVPGGPPPTPTPTPTPYCTLFCPGVLGGGADSGGIQGFGSGGPGIQGGNSVAPTVMPPLASGNIRYYGYNNFNCGTFADGKWFNGPCPTQAPGGGAMSGGLSNQWEYPQKFNMLCGQTPHTYQATIQSGSGGGSGGQPGGGFSTPTPTNDPLATPSPTPRYIYPPGCSGGIPDPTPTTPPGGNLGLGNKGGSGSGTNACACAVTLSCQSSLQPVPSSTGTGCTATCDFTVNPDYPIYNTSSTFAISQNTPGTGITFSFDDGSNNVSNQPSTGHTFVNAGVYDVTLSCSATSETCKRRVNTYCNNGVVPSPTPTPSPTPGPWFKVKDADFVRAESGITNAIPSSVTAFDSDDTGSPDCSGQLGGGNIRCMAVNQPGLIISKNTIDVGSAPISGRAWKLENYTLKRQIDASSYVDYVSSRKKPKLIDRLEEIQTGYINRISGDQIINDVTMLKSAPFVLIVEGNLTIDVGGTFGYENYPAAFVVTGTLNITSQTTELDGIFIANNLDVASDVSTGSTTPNLLKIKGNISVTHPSTTLIKRSEDGNARPGVFTVLDFTPFKELLPLLTVRTYEWEELTP